MSEPELLISSQGGVRTITFNRPDHLNSLSLGTIKLLLDAIRDISRDRKARALVLTGAGRGFCAGWHLDEGGVPGLPDESFGVRQSHLMEEYFNPVIQSLNELPIAVVASVNGICAGAGVSLALAADIIIAAKNASFILTFAPKLGIIPDLGASWKLPRTIGWARAKAVTLLGERIPADTAVVWGMIYKSVEGNDLAAESSRIAQKLAEGPPGVALEVRRAYHAAQSSTLQTQMDYERLRQRDLLDSPAFAEGLQAFQEKREPKFHRDEPEAE